MASLEGDSPRGGEMSRSDRGDRALFARCLRSRLKGGSTRRAQKFMLPTIHGGQRSLRPQARFGGQPGLKIPALRPEMAPLYFPVNRPMSPSRAQYFPQKFPISHPATGQFSTLIAFFADNSSCLRSVFHYLCKTITRSFVIYSCAILQL